MDIDVPAFQPHYHVEPLDGEGVFFLHENGQALMAGKLYASLARLIDGQRSTDDIVAELADVVSDAEVYFGLGQLKKRGHIVEQRPLDGASAAYWARLGLGAEHVAEQLSKGALELTYLDGRAAGPVEAAIAALGLASDQPGGLQVVVTDDYLRPTLREINRVNLASNRPWLLAKIDGSVIWLGPYFANTPGVPETNACWECVAQRLWINRTVETFLMDRRGSDDPLVAPLGHLPSTLALGAQMLATEIAKTLVTGGNARLTSKLLTYDTLETTLETHTVVRRPQCPACGDPAAHAAQKPIVLQSRPKVFTAEGGHRTLLPEQTVRNLEHHVSPLTGAITRLIRTDTGENPVMHVYWAGHNFSQHNINLHFLKRSLRTNSGGKGASDIQARASAMGEALERYSGVYRGDEELTTATYQELGAQALHPNSLMLYSDHQYETRLPHYDDRTLFEFVPARFREDIPTAWVKVWSMTAEAFKYVPALYCYYNYAPVAGLRNDDVFCLADSNGTAAGNNLEEAILQGFMELIERDAVGIFWYNRVRRPLVDLDSFDEPYLRIMQTYFKQIGRELYVLDLTSDLGIPTFAGVLWRNEPGKTPEIIVGFGAHFDARLALMRALTECNQFLASFVRSPEDSAGRYDGFEPIAVTWWKTATFENQPYLVPDDSLPKCTAADYPEINSPDLKLDVERCVALMRAKGLEMLVLDQTRPDVGLAVVKVMVPGLRHFWKRLAPGRLYDVPVQLGWRAQPTPEADMNPFPVFF